MKTIITYPNFLDNSNENISIGGVQTYLSNLSNLIISNGGEVDLYQRSKEKFETNFNGINVYGFSQDSKKKFLTEAIKISEQEKKLLIFGADIFSLKTNYPKAINIQHGIGWDVSRQHLYLGETFLPDNLVRYLNYSRALDYFNNCKNSVLVDYNFLNWHRATIGNVKDNVWVIPNASNHEAYRDTRHKKSEQRKPISILIARRFEKYRGIELMAEVAESILIDNENVNICFAGEGPLKEFLETKFSNEKRVQITKFPAHESISFHQKFDIAVLPSLGSEGTSLSLIEAMISGCAVVSTNIGGLSNMIIDNFNGLLAMPKKDDLVNSITKLVLSETLRYELSSNAKKVASKSFGIERWREQWLNVLNFTDRKI